MSPIHSSLRPQKSGTHVRIVPLLWITCGLFLAGCGVFLLLGRLGLPSSIVNLIFLIMAAIVVIALGWFGRTMTSATFFFSERRLTSAATGFGGGTDWAGGAFLLVFASSTLAQQSLWAPGLFVGLLLMSALFANAFARLGFATLPGFLNWRYPKSGSGTLAVLISAVILALLLAAEFSVARLALGRLGSSDPASIAWIVLALAALPALLGGWLSLIFVNVVLALWLTISLLLPTLMVGLLPGILGSDAASLVQQSNLQPITTIVEQVLPQNSFIAGLLTLIVLACGFSVLPHAMTRLSLLRRPSAGMEHAGWSALFVFLALSAVPLSLGLILRSPNDGAGSDLSQLLAGQPVLHMLPYGALLFAALNAMSATMLALASSVMRGIQRFRNLDPGERTMFGSRMMIIIVAVAMGWWGKNIDVSIGQFLLLAICLGAATLFVPLASAVWLARVPRFAVSLAMLIGLVVMVPDLAATVSTVPIELPIDFASPVFAAALGLVASATVVVTAKVISWSMKRNLDDPKVQWLRGKG